MRKWLIVLMAAVAIGATGILGWLYMRQDRKGPEITIAESKKNSYTSDMTTEDLLEGVKAVDKRDGDVSASLTVENVYPNEKGDEVTVVYVAKDNSNNVTKVTYHMTSEGNLIVFIQALPQHICKLIHVIRNLNKLRLTLKAWQRVSITFISMDKMSLTSLCILICKSVTVAGGRISIIAL